MSQVTFHTLSITRDSSIQHSTFNTHCNTFKSLLSNLYPRVIIVFFILAYPNCIALACVFGVSSSNHSLLLSVLHTVVRNTIAMSSFSKDRRTTIMDEEEEHHEITHMHHNHRDNEGESGGAGSSNGYEAEDDDEELHPQDSQYQNHVIAKQETIAVFRLRTLVFLILFCAASAVSACVFVVTRNGEINQFQSNFAAHSAQIVNSFEEIVGQKIRALASLGVSFTSYARSRPNATTETVWPFVTMNDFQQQAATARSLSSALFLEILPVVAEDQREQWEEYSMQNMGWLAEGRAYQEKLGLGDSRLLQESTEAPSSTSDSSSTTTTANVTLDFSSGIGNKIYSLDASWSPIVDPGPGPYFPIWESSPVLKRDLVNYNLIRYEGYRPGILTAYETGDIALGGITTAEPGTTAHPDLTTSFFAFILSFAAKKSVTYQGDPMSSVYIPVFATPDQVTEDNVKPVGIIVGVIHWATYFLNILSNDDRGIVIVLSNTCDGSFTLQIDGPHVTYIGKGDLHDTQFHHYRHSVHLKDILQSESILQLGLPLNQDTCPYTLDIYPSQAMMDAYTTSLPVFLTVAIGMIFVFTTIMFFVYDRLVERRQRLVLRTAEQSNAIVSSLFPEMVHQRLLLGDTDGTNGDGTNGKSSHTIKGGNGGGGGGGGRNAFSTPQSRLKSYLADGGDEDGELDVKPIADLFPECTVMFCDISGFTAWSSTRDPAQVFILLQTIYQAFDVLAKKHRVFKVETIGDSYVAVTGLPNPQDKHALFMARFAWECMAKFNDLVKKLEVTLGPDTGDLAMRFGMHSGPVTAGVLRGDRSRFQLFGDTVNTAARMER
jgi:hypothetical protein